MQAVELLLSDNRGVYIPKDFISSFDMKQWNIELTDAEKEIMQDPLNDLYWEIWQTIERDAKFTKDGHEWRLFQDGDLFAYCSELMTEQERDELFGCE